MEVASKAQTLCVGVSGRLFTGSLRAGVEKCRTPDMICACNQCGRRPISGRDVSLAKVKAIERHFNKAANQ